MMDQWTTVCVVCTIPVWVQCSKRYTKFAVLTSKKRLIFFWCEFLSPLFVALFQHFFPIHISDEQKESHLAACIFIKQVEHCLLATMLGIVYQVCCSSRERVWSSVYVLVLSFLSMLFWQAEKSPLCVLFYTLLFLLQSSPHFCSYL